MGRTSFRMLKLGLLALILLGGAAHATEEVLLGDHDSRIADDLADDTENFLADDSLGSWVSRRRRSVCPNGEKRSRKCGCQPPHTDLRSEDALGCLVINTNLGPCLGMRPNQVQTACCSCDNTQQAIAFVEYALCRLDDPENTFKDSEGFICRTGMVASLARMFITRAQSCLVKKRDLKCPAGVEMQLGGLIAQPKGRQVELELGDRFGGGCESFS